MLPTGPVPPKPAELLASPRSHEVLASLQADDTLVIVDTPPLLLATDAVALAPALGGILLVATARVTRKKELRKALELLRQVDAPLLGMVLQSADSAETGGFGEERSRRERRQAHRQRELNGATAAEPAHTSASSASPNGATAAEPALTIAWSAPPNGTRPPRPVDAGREQLARDDELCRVTLNPSSVSSREPATRRRPLIGMAMWFERSG